MQIDELIAEHKSGEDRTIEIFELEEIQKFFKKYSVYIKSKTNKPFHECEQLCYEAFVNALRSFKSEKGSSLSTVWYIWCRPVIQNDWCAGEYNSIFGQKYHVKADHAKIHAFLENHPHASVRDITEATGIVCEKRIRNLMCIPKNPTNLDYENENGMPIHDIPYYDNVDLTEDMEFALSGELFEALDKLSTLQRKTIIDYYGLSGDNGRTYQELANEEGVSPQAIQNRKFNAVINLKKHLKK